MPRKPLRCSWLAMARRRELARTSGLGHWFRLSFGLRAGKSGSKIVRPFSGSSSIVPAKDARGKQNHLGVEDWDFPAKTKPPARAFLSAAIRCFATAIIVSGAAADRPGKTFSNVIGRFAWARARSLI
jgi:hypothetical protein